MTYYSIRLYPARETLPLPPLQILPPPLQERNPTLLPLYPDPTPPLQERDPTPLPPSPDPTPPLRERESGGTLI